MGTTQICVCTNNAVIVLIAAWIPLLMVSSNAYITEHQDVATMANVIGSGAMNIDHYFHTLGVACENRNLRFWKTIEQDRIKCMNVRESARSKGYYESLPQGSFEKMCTNWKNNEICNINFARDLNDCFGQSSRGSDALAFMEAYVSFACRDIQDTETQLAIHTGSRSRVDSPGVFKCFPELHGRILNCAKEDRYSNSVCSQFSTVQSCFSRFYTSYKVCNNILVVNYMRDLFQSMVYTLKCPPGPDVWDNVESQTPNSVVNHLRFYPTSMTSIPYQFQPANKYNNQNQPAATTPIITNEHNDSPGPSTIFLAPYSRENSVLLPRPLSPLLIHNSKAKPTNLVWKPVPLHIYSTQPQPLPSPPLDYSDIHFSRGYESPLGAWFNLQQKKFSTNKTGPAWAWGYERYASPRTNHQQTTSGDTDRFYSYRVEPRHEQHRTEDSTPAHVDRGLYELYQVHYDRYGLPRSRGLSNRNNQQNWRNPKVVMLDNEQSLLWDQHDNHFRKFKDDHMFQGQQYTSTSRISYNPIRVTHSVPGPSSNAKRKVKATVDEDYTTEKTEAYEIEKPNYNIVVITHTSEISTTQKPDSPSKGYRNKTLISHRNNNGQFLRRVTTTKTPLHKIIVNEIPTTTSFSYPSSSLGSPSSLSLSHDYQSEVPLVRGTHDQEYFSSTDPSYTPKTSHFGPIPMPKNNEIGQFPFLGRTSSQNGTKSTPVHSYTRKYLSKNFTFPPWPRQQGSANLSQSPEQGTPIPVLSKRAPSNIGTSISKTEPQSVTDLLDFHENDFSRLTATTIRSKILRKIKVRKRPNYSTTTTTTDTDTFK